MENIENIEKYTDFLKKNSEFFSKMSKSAFGKISSIAQWWHRTTEGFCSMSGTGNGGGHYIFTYINSCQYTDHLIKELKLSISSLVQESYLKSENILLENQELKSLIYGMLDEINELKEHNKSLSERKFLLEKFIELENKIKDLSEHNKQLSYRLSVFDD